MGLDKIACVLIGGGIGSVLRFLMVSGVQRLFPDYPAGTWCVNIIGSFIIGIIWAVCSFFDFSPNLRAFLLVGLLGGFTTFSSFSLETMNLLNAGKIQSALSYIVCTNVGGIIAVFGGFFLAKYSLYAIKLL